MRIATKKDCLKNWLIILFPLWFCGIFAVIFSLLKQNFKNDKKQYYQIRFDSYVYYAKSYEFDSTDNSINFVDINGNVVKIYGNASIVSPQETSNENDER